MPAITTKFEGCDLGTIGTQAELGDNYEAGILSCL